MSSWASWGVLVENSQPHPCDSRFVVVVGHIVEDPHHVIVEWW